VCVCARVRDRSVASRSASFYVGHSTTILPLFAALGLFRDPQPLTAAVWNSSSTIRDRQFRTSRIDPMSSNIAFTLYDCAACQGLLPYSMGAVDAMRAIAPIVKKCGGVAPTPQTFAPSGKIRPTVVVCFQRVLRLLPCTKLHKMTINVLEFRFRLRMGLAPVTAGRIYYASRIS